MQSQVERVLSAISSLKQGKMIVLTDHPDRENEGDLIVAAEFITPSMMNFMIRQGSGIVCLSLTQKHLEKLELPLMVKASANNSLRGTPFTVSIDAKEGIISGVSAIDRTKTILTAIKDNVRPEDLIRPGHVFPLQARNGGVLEREGHTEGALDLMFLAGLKPAAVLCEIMNSDGTMARGIELKQFALQHQLQILAIQDVVAYRLNKNKQVINFD